MPKNTQDSKEKRIDTNTTNTIYKILNICEDWLCLTEIYKQLHPKDIRIILNILVDEDYLEKKISNNTVFYKIKKDKIIL